MRAAIKRPSLRLKEVSSAAVNLGRPAAKVLDSARLSRAKQIHKSAKVSKFSKDSGGEKTETKSKAVIKAADVRPLSAAVPSAVARPGISHQRLERMLDQALFTADAHKQALKRSSRTLRPFGLPKWLTISLLVLLTITVGALIVWRSIPAVAIKAAAWRSHVSASTPSYAPTGYGLSNVASDNDSVTLKYATKVAGPASYSLNESASSWDSQSLQANTLSKDKTVQTSEVDGTTVYIYGSSRNAEWVNNGHLYKLDNSSSHLSSDQILHIAQGL